VVLIVVVAAVSWVLPSYYTGLIALVGLYGLVTLGLNLFMGYAGQVSLGQAAFFGIGAYGSAVLATRFGISPWLGTPVGALAVAVGDKVFMLENSVYSVISPEGCATIMWRDSAKAEVAAEALKITATDLQNLQLIDGIVPEPEGGAHLNHEATARALDPFLSLALDELTKLSTRQLLDQRYAKFRRMGQFFS